MAKQVEDIVVRLVGEGFEALDKIKGSFRELGKVTNLAEKDILSARDSLLDYARKAGNTEAVNKGLGDAFKGLRSQVDLCSDAYRVLSADLRQIDEVSRGATQSVMAQREAVLASTAAGTQNVAALQQQRAALIALRAQTRDASTAFDQFSADIQAVDTRLTDLADVNRRFNATLVQGTAATAAGARVQLEALTAGIALRRQDLADIDTRSARERNLRATIEQRLGVEQRLNTALSVRRRIQFQEGARTGREGARTGAATFNDPTVTAGFLAPDRVAQRIGDLPNTTAGLSQELGELNERLINTYRNTETYIAVQLRLAGVQRQVSAATQGFGAALRAQLDTGTLVPSQKNLAEVIGQLRREMLELDTTTTNDARAFQLLERQARSLERQLSALQTTQANLAATPASGFAAFSQSITPQAGDRAIQGSIKRNRAKQERERRRLEREAEDFFSQQPTLPLLLPAAGQTTSRGPGGAVPLRGQRGALEGVGGQFIGPVPPPQFGPQLTESFIYEQEALRKKDIAVEASKQKLNEYRAAVDKAAGANDKSVNSMGNLREAVTRLRNAVPSTDAEFDGLTKRLQRLDQQIEKTQTRGRRLTGSQLAQGVGAALSGGIFGGPEGLIGGLGGLAVGGVGGAFAGAAFGAQVGMFRQQLGGTADYAASIGKLQIALRGVVGSQEAYDAAIRAAAAATRDLNIPQEEATRGLTRLSAAVIGAGGTVADSSFAFRAMSEAIKATGGNAEQVDGALLALTQVFSKGKVSAEELNQIAERLPGTFTLFAQAAGKTGPELQKALEQGEVGLNDLMKFLDLTSKRYGTTALTIASSSQDAGARLTVAFQAMRLEVGKALQPLGAELQETFTAFIKDITPAVVGSAKALAGAIKLIADNGGFISEVLKTLLGFGAVAGAAAGVTQLSAAIKSLTLLTSGVTGLSGALGIAKASAQSLSITMAAIPGVGWAAAGAVALALLTKAVYDNNDTFKKWVDNIGGVVASDFQAAIDGMKRDASSAFDFIGDLLPDYESKTAQSQQNVADGWSVTFKSIRDGAFGFVTDIQKAFAGLFDLLPPWARKILIDSASGTGAGLAFKIADYSASASQRAIAVTGQNTGMYGRYGAPETQVPTAAATEGLSVFNQQAADKEAKDKAARDKARRDAEAAAAEQQRYLESFMQQQIRVADTVFQHQKDLDRQRFDLLKELTDIEAQNRINKLFGPEREAANIQERRRQRTLDYENRILTAMNAVAAAQQKFSSAQQMAAVTAGAGLPGAPGAPNIGGFTPRQLSSATTAASKFTGIANMCSESVKAFYTSLGITLPGVTAWADTVRKSGQVMTDWSKIQAGDIVATGRPGDTPHVGVYTGGNNVFHQSRSRGLTAGNYPDLDYFRSGYFVRPTAAAGRQATGVAAQQRRNVTDTGDVAMAGLDLKQAQTTLANLVSNTPSFNAVAAEEQVIALTASLLTQNYELEKTITLETKRFDLVLKGYSAERIALEQKFDQARIARDAALTGVGDETQVLAINTAYERQIVLLQELYDAQTQFNNSFGAGFQTGVQQYVQSLGTMNQAAAQLTQSGLKGIEDTLFSLVTIGTANFREFAAEILKQSARMILQLTIQRVIMQILGAIGGGGAPVSPSAPGGDWMGAVGRMNPTSGYAMGGAFAKNNIVPYAMGGIVTKPTLFKFANGGTTRTGLMGEAGPEAIMPLSRGANGKLGVASTGGSAHVSVTVNVDASGNSQVAGDQNQGAQLGRVIAGAVQQELIRQKRPGGLLA